MGQHEPGSEGFSLTAEQLEAARAERMRHNGLGTLTFEDARTWIEETGLCLFLPRKQFVSSIAPSFVEAIAGRRDATPDVQQISAAEELLIRLENEGVAVRLNLGGQPGEQPDFVVASWVLPYVYALRGDRDWRRTPQLTGSRAVSQLAVQAYKFLEANDLTISQLKHSLGREVTEAAVVRAITELWQQLRIIPTISSAGQPAKWQLLRHRYQKAIAEGASTSQVTAISVLASIYLQAVIAASMEEVELFLAPLTARSKVREVLRGLVATRQVHTISMGHAPHFYVAGTLPEFAPAPIVYGNAGIPISSYYMNGRDTFGSDPEETRPAPAISYAPSFSAPTPTPVAKAPESQSAPAPARPAIQVPPSQVNKPLVNKPQASTPAPRTHFSRPAPHNRNRKPATPNRPANRTANRTAIRPGQSANGSRAVRRGVDARPSASRSPNGSRNGSRPTNGSRPAQGARWNGNGHTSSSGKSNGHSPAKKLTGASRSGGALSHSNGNGSATRNGKSAAPSWSKRSNGHAKVAKTGAKSASIKRKTSLSRKDSRVDARAKHGDRKPALTAGAKGGNSKRFGFTARPSKKAKKRG